MRATTANPILVIARQKIPFLNEVPDEIYFSLDPSEFFLPDTDVAEARRKMEEIQWEIIELEDGLYTIPKR